MKWFVQLSENGKTKELADLEKFPKMHDPEFAVELYEIYLGEAALFMWQQARDTETHAQEAAEEAEARRVQARMESRLRMRLVFPEEFQKEYDTLRIDSTPFVRTQYHG